MRKNIIIVTGIILIVVMSIVLSGTGLAKKDIVVGEAEDDIPYVNVKIMDEKNSFLESTVFTGVLIPVVTVLVTLQFQSIWNKRQLEIDRTYKIEERNRVNKIIRGLIVEDVKVIGGYILGMNDNKHVAINPIKINGKELKENVIKLEILEPEESMVLLNFIMDYMLLESSLENLYRNKKRDKQETFIFREVEVYNDFITKQIDKLRNQLEPSDTEFNLIISKLEFR